MDNSYPAVYGSYARFCSMIGQTPMQFEDWMVAREDQPKPKDKAKEFIQGEPALVDLP